MLIQTSGKQVFAGVKEATNKGKASKGANVIDSLLRMIAIVVDLLAISSVDYPSFDRSFCLLFVSFASIGEG